MSMVKIDSFSGLRPAASEIRLAVNEAVKAENAYLRRKLLSPRPTQLLWDKDVDPVLPIDDANTAVTLYRFNDLWLYWETDVNVVASPTVGDTGDRHYYTGDPTAPKMFTEDSVDDSSGTPDPKYPYNWFYLGIPAPVSAPTVTADEFTPPDVTLGGQITSVTPDNLAVQIFKYNHGDSINDDGAQTTNIYSQSGNGVQLTLFGSGSRVSVVSIIDVDNVEVSGSATAAFDDYGQFLYQFARADYQLAWSSTSGRTLWSNNYQWQFLARNTAVMHAPAHTLQVGDTVRITTATVPLSYVTTPVLNIDLAQSPGLSGGEYPGGHHRIPITIVPTSGTIEFTGDVSYVIERGSTVIDPGAVEVVSVETDTRSYVYTYVSFLGEEGPPSPPTDPVTIATTSPVTLSDFAAPPTDHRNITNIRIYRASTGSAATEFQLVAEVPYVALMTYEDTVSAAQLGEVIPSELWDPPDPSMIGICALPIGCLAGFFANTVCFSEPGFGHAWPEDYRQGVEEQIVAISPLSQVLVVLTNGVPYIAAGAHPASITLRRTNIRHPCMDKMSVVNDGSAIIYCSPNGLVRITQGGSELLTEGFYDRATWAAVVGPPEVDERSLRAWYHDDKYLLQASYTIDDVETVTKLVFDVKNETVEITTFTENIQAGFYIPATGEFFYVTPDADLPSGSDTPDADTQPILRWEYNSPGVDPVTQYQTAVWWSKTFTFDRPMNLAAARILCRRLKVNGDYEAFAQVSVNIYGVRYGVWDTATETLVDETTLVSSAEVIDGAPGSGGWAGEQRSKPFRIPSTGGLYDAMRFELTVKGAAEVEAVALAESMEELLPTP